jgi:hypothetical protein
MIVRIVRYRSRDSCILRERIVRIVSTGPGTPAFCVKRIVRIVRYRSRG